MSGYGAFHEPLKTEGGARFASWHRAVCALMVLLMAGVGLLGAEGESLFPIRAGRMFGLIDRAGKVVVAPQYEKIEEFHEGLAVFWSGGKAGYLDGRGKVAIAAEYTLARDFAHGRAIVMKDGKYLLIDPQGKVVAEAPYRILGDFSAGLVVVQRPRNGTTPAAYGYMDRNGKMVIEPRFMPAGAFPEDGGLAVGGLERHWCYFDRTGKIVLRLPMEGHDRSIPFRDGLIRWKEGFVWGYKDARGEWAIAPQFEDARDFEDGMAQVELGGKWGWIDRKGKKVEPVKGPRRVRAYADGLALAVDGDLTGWLQADGKPAFAFRKYEQAFDYACGLARVKVDGKFGYLDKSGRLAIGAEYYGAGDFKGCLASVLTKDGWAYIDTGGKVVWKAEGKF